VRHGKRQHGQWPYSRSALKRVLGVYTACPEYRARLIERAARIDLDGNPAGTVTAGEAAYALAPRPAKKTKPTTSPAPPPPAPSAQALGSRGSAQGRATAEGAGLRRREICQSLPPALPWRGRRAKFFDEYLCVSTI